MQHLKSKEHLYTEIALKRIRERRSKQSNGFKKTPKKAKNVIDRPPMEVLENRIFGFQSKSRCDRPFGLSDVLKKFGHSPKCHFTGESVSWEKKDSYQLDHFIPIARAGNSELENMVICTPRINRMKGALLPEEFIEVCQKVISRLS